MNQDKIKNIKAQMVQDNFDAVFISSVSSITYLTGYANFSKEEREAYVFIGRDFAYIITDGRYSEAIKTEVPYLKLYERGGEKSTEELFKKHQKEIKLLGIEENNLTVSEHKLLKKHFKKIKHFNLERSVKEKRELEKIEKACQLGDKAFKYILKKIKPGITEKQLAYEIENYIKINGADLSFPTIVAFGKNSSIPHHHTGDTVLPPPALAPKARDHSAQEGLIILLDFGVKLDNFCSDMSRTLILGKVSGRQRKMYKAVLEAQKRAVNFINSSVKAGKQIRAGQVDKVAREYISSKGFPSIPHSLGHGIGLEVHEHPSISFKSREILMVGMVFSIEPGIYIPGFGGIRIEDLFILEKEGLRQITNSSKQFHPI